MSDFDRLKQFVRHTVESNESFPVSFDFIRYFLGFESTVEAMKDFSQYGFQFTVDFTGSHFNDEGYPIISPGFAFDESRFIDIYISISCLKAWALRLNNGDSLQVIRVYNDTICEINAERLDECCDLESVENTSLLSELSEPVYSLHVFIQALSDIGLDVDDAEDLERVKMMVEVIDKLFQ